jgi:hypothetical protein
MTRILLEFTASAKPKTVQENYLQVFIHIVLLNEVHKYVSLELHCKSNVIFNLQINKNLYQNFSLPYISVNQ